MPSNFNEVSRFIDRGFGSSPPPATPLLFVAFDLSTPASIELDDFAGVRLTFGVNGNILTLGKLAGSNEFLVGAGGFVSTGITVQPNTTYHLVSGYEVGTDLLSIWINPDAADFYTPGGGTNSADAIKIQPGTGHANVVYLDTSRPGYIFDNLVLSDTAEGVGLNQQVVPEPGSFLIWSILAVVLSGLVLARRAVLFDSTRKTAMTTRNKLFAALLICLISSLADPANALEVRNNMAFSTVNQNPWVPGASFEQEFTFDELRPSFGPIDLPTLHGNPVSALVDFLDVDEYLPFDADASVGGSFGGSAGLTFRYYVTGGRLNMKYPARTSLDIAATLPGTLDTVVAGRTSAIHSAFLPGVTGVTRPISLVSDAAGLGYAEQSVPGFTMETFRDPEFSTTNPYAAAAVDLGFDVRVNAFAEASVKSFGECITCVTKRFSFGTDADVTLAAVSPDGVSVAAGAYELEFDQDIDFLGIGSVRASYPDVQVHSQPLAPDASLHGFASQHAITVQGHLEKLVPVIGPISVQLDWPVWLHVAVRRRRTVAQRLPGSHVHAAAQRAAEVQRAGAAQGRRRRLPADELVPVRARRRRRVEADHGIARPASHQPNLLPQ